MSASPKVALITGGAKRVGRACALVLARAGWDVAITYHRSHAEAQHVQQEIEALGRRALIIGVDNARADAAEAIFAAVTQTFPRLDALVNNASHFATRAFGQISAAEYDRNQAINARTPLMLMQKFAPLLGAHYSAADADSAGRIVNFIDIHVMGEPLKHYLAYNAAKAALMEITMSGAMELAPRVTVNAIAPGVVAWEESYTQAQREQYLQRVPLARAGTPEDAARTVRFLVCEASYCTGQIIRLDGGRFLT